MNARFLDIHVLQMLPPSCVNRGEHDLPKTFQLGNSTRAVVTSQSLKRAIRTAIEKALGEYAVRTRRIPPRVIDALKDAGWPDDLATFAGSQIARCATPKGLDSDSGRAHRTQNMIYTAEAHLIDDLVALCASHRTQLQEALAATTAPKNGTEGEAEDEENTAPKRDVKGKRKAEENTTPRTLPGKEVGRILARRTACIDLFGRMLAGHEDSRVAGAVQMAWAFTTHTAERQPDFYTAQEDWGEPGDRGSAFLSTAFLTAGVFYRYASVNLTDLIAARGGRQDALDLLGLFINAFLYARPGGKQNSTAPNTLPDTVTYTVRDSCPVSYADAFDQPVRADRHGGYLAPSRRALSAHAATSDRLAGTRDRIGHGHTTAHTSPLEHLGPHHAGFHALTAAAVADAASPRA